MKELLSPAVFAIVADARTFLPFTAPDDAFMYILDLMEPAVDFNDEEQEAIKKIILENWKDCDFIFMQVLMAATVSIFRDEIIPKKEYMDAIIEPQKYIKRIDSPETIGKILEYINEGGDKGKTEFEKILSMIENHIQEKIGSKIRGLEERIKLLEKPPLPPPQIPDKMPVHEEKENLLREWILAGVVAIMVFTATLAAMVVAMKTNSPTVFMVAGGCVAAAGYYLIKAKKV